MVELRRERPGSGPVVTGLTRTGFRLQGTHITGGLMLTPEQAHGWDAPAFADLGEASLQTLLDLEPSPEFILLGTGRTLVHPARALVDMLSQRSIGVEVMDSRAAVRAWAVLRAEDRWIGAAIYPHTDALG